MFSLHIVNIIKSKKETKRKRRDREKVKEDMRRDEQKESWDPQHTRVPLLELTENKRGGEVGLTRDQ